MSEKSTNLLEVITGLLMIVASLLGWWVKVLIGQLVSIAFWEWSIYDEIQLWQSIFIVAFSIIFFVGGFLYFIPKFKISATWQLIRFIILCVAFAGLLTATLTIMIDKSLPTFQITPLGYQGWGPGLYFGIAAIVFGAIDLLKGIMAPNE